MIFFTAKIGRNSREPTAPGRYMALAHTGSRWLPAMYHCALHTPGAVGSRLLNRISYIPPGFARICYYTLRFAQSWKPLGDLLNYCRGGKADIVIREAAEGLARAHPVASPSLFAMLSCRREP